MKSLFILFCIFSVKVYAECWSESLGYPCCSDKNANVVMSDKDGNWSIENGEWCGIPKTSTKTVPTTRTCRTYTFTHSECTKSGGYVTSITRSGCPTPTCILPSSTIQKTSDCWSKSLGYPCCSDNNAKIVFSDEEGDWSIENGEWCGIPKTSTKTIPIPCPAITFTYDQCSKRGGYVTSVTKSGCPTPTCVVVEKKCWSEALGYPCCSPDNTKVIYTDEDGDWGNENMNWCGMLKDETPTPTIKKHCPTPSFPYNDCIKKGGSVKQVIIDDCPYPSCSIIQECWSLKYGYPCCDYYYHGSVTVDERGEWGKRGRNGDICGILKDVKALTY